MVVDCLWEVVQLSLLKVCAALRWLSHLLNEYSTRQLPEKLS